MAQMSESFEFRLLGPFEIWEDGTQIEIRGARARALLAILLLNAGRSMVIGQLAEALWGGRPPRTMRDSIQFFVHQIRRDLGTGAGSGLLRTTSSGYALQVEPGQLDTERFAWQLQQARAAHAAGQLERAWDRYAQAMSLWRGQPLADFAGEAFALPEIGRLEELRLTTLEEQLRTGIELGRHAELIGDAEGLVREQPLREHVRALLMLALYRAGRQAEALEAYQAGRAVSVDQLGIEPGADLRALERAIRTHDPVLLEPRAAALATPAAGAAVDLAVPAPLGPAPTGPADAGDGSTGTTLTTAVAGPPPPEVAQRDERKIVTVLVAGVAETGSGDPEDVRGQTTAVLDRITRRIEHYGGVVQAAAMGRLLAVFGAARSQEDDPERAVRAGLEICAAPPAGGQAVRVGVATGEVVVSLGASGQAPGETTVVGDVIHAATSLSAAAPLGSVQVGAGTYRTTSRSIEYRRVEPTDPSQHALEQLTGVQVWEAVQPLGRTGAQVTDQLDSPLVERERELGLLADLLQRFLRDGEPQLLTLISDPGLGKSRLVAELAQLVDNTEALVTWRVGRSMAYGEGTFWALAEIVKSHANVLETDPAEVADDKIRAVVSSAVTGPEQAAAALESLRVLLGPAAPRERTPELFSGWYQFFTAVAVQRPTVVVFEDLQWADESLLEFVAGLADHVGPVPLLVAATGRPELLDRRASWGGGQRNAISLSLPPLSRDGTAALLDALLPGPGLPAETRAALLASSGGNPLYVEEYVRMLQERDPDTLGGDPLGEADLPVPATVHQLIAARLDSLPVEDKRLLQDAAVIGEVGWVGALAAASDRDPADVHAAVRRLERRGLLRRVRRPSVAGETEYAFRHALVRDVAYSQLLRGERSAQHLRVAEWIVSLNPDPGERVEMLAHHYERALQLAQASGTASADLVERTRHVLRAAGDRARQLGALASAEHCYAAALKLWPSADPERPELQFELGRVQCWYQLRGGALLTEARDAFIAAGNSVRAAQSALQLASLARNSGDPAGSQAHLEDALALNPDDRAAWVVAMAGQSLELNIRGYLIEAITFGRDIAREANELGLHEEEGLTLVAVGMARLESGDPDGDDDCVRSIAQMELARSPAVHRMRWARAQGLSLYGDVERASEVATEARRLIAAPGTAAPTHLVHWLDATLSTVDYGAGRWDAVVAYVEAALARAGGERGYPEPWYRPVRGRVRLGRGDLDGALEDAVEGRTAAELSGETRMMQPSQALQARALLAGGQRDQAANLVDAILAEQRYDTTTATVTPDQAVVMIEFGYPDSALPDDLWPTRWHRAARLLLARDFAAAVHLLEAGGASADAATARLYLARALAGEGRVDAARSELAQAVDFWRRAGASAYLAEAEALAAALTTPRGAGQGRG